MDLALDFYIRKLVKEKGPTAYAMGLASFRTGWDGLSQKDMICGPAMTRAQARD